MNDRIVFFLAIILCRFITIYIFFYYYFKKLYCKGSNLKGQTNICALQVEHSSINNMKFYFIVEPFDSLSSLLFLITYFYDKKLTIVKVINKPLKIKGKIYFTMILVALLLKIYHFKKILFGIILNSFYPL